MAHNNFEQLKILLSLFDKPCFDIFLHIDAKANNAPIDEFTRYVKNAGLYLINRMAITWGDASQVRAHIALLDAAARHDHYLYYHSISGQDLPLLRTGEFIDFFNSRQGAEFVGIQHSELDKTFDINDRRRVSVYRFWGSYGKKQPWLKCAGAASHLQQKIGINRTKHTGLTYGKGEAWYSITENFVEWILERKDMVMHLFGNRTFTADEVWVQTMLLSSPFVKNRWAAQSNEHEQCVRAIDWHRGSPYIYRSEDFENLINSGMVFARKFDSTVDCDIIYKIVCYLQS